MKSHAFQPTFAVAAILFGAFAGNSLCLISLHAAEWPHWRGPQRSDIVAEPSGWTGEEWPLGEVAWSTNAGLGSTSPIVVDGKLYTLGWYDNADHLTCRDAVSGKLVWEQSYPCPKYGRHSTGDKGIYSGVSSTPAFDVETKLLYTLSTDGDLKCWDTQQAGKQVWDINLYDRYDVRQRPDVARRTLRDYGYTTSPLVWGDSLLVEVGDDTGNLIAFNKRNGKQLWASECKDEAGHTGGPVPITVEGIPCAAVLTLRNLVVTRIDPGHEGKTLAQYKWTTDFANNIPTPTVHENEVLITTAYNHYTICKLRITLQGAEKVWETEHASGVCSPVVHEGHIYWAWRGIHCLDWKTGKQEWMGGKVGTQGSCILTSDERLIVWSNKGDLQLIETARRSPDKLTVLAEKKGIFRTDVWPHVVLADSRLYLKDRDGNLQCVPIGALALASSKAAESPMPPQPKTAPKPVKTLALKEWPGDDPALLVAWKPQLGSKKIVGRAAEGEANNQLAIREKAIIEATGMTFTGGAVHVKNADDELLSACRSTGELTVESVITSSRARQSGPARIITFSTDGFSRNFTLGQDGDRLLFRLRTPRTGNNGMNPQTVLTSIDPQRRYHLIVSYRDGQLVCYVDGKQVSESRKVTGDFSNWSRQHLLLGDEWDGGGTRVWKGQMECVAILNRFIGAAEAKRRFELLAK